MDGSTKSQSLTCSNPNLSFFVNKPNHNQSGFSSNNRFIFETDLALKTYVVSSIVAWHHTTLIRAYIFVYICFLHCLFHGPQSLLESSTHTLNGCKVYKWLYIAQQLYRTADLIVCSVFRQCCITSHVIKLCGSERCCPTCQRHCRESQRLQLDF